MLKQFIEQLTLDMGFEQALDANEDGSYSLRLEPDINVVLKEDADSVIMFRTQLTDLPPADTEEFLRRAMVANLLGRETGGAALGLDEGGKRVVLVDSLLEESDYRIFHERLEDFVNYADAWRQETLEFCKHNEAEE